MNVSIVIKKKIKNIILEKKLSTEILVIIIFIDKEPSKIKSGHKPNGLYHKISAKKDNNIKILIDEFFGSNMIQPNIKHNKKSGFSIITGWLEMGEIGRTISKIPMKKIIIFLCLIIFMRYIYIFIYKD